MTRGGVHVLALRPGSRLCAAELSGARSEFQRPVLINYDQQNECLPSLNRTGAHVSTGCMWNQPRRLLVRIPSLKIRGGSSSKTSLYGS